VNRTASLDDYRWLVSSEAGQLLARLQSTPFDLVRLASQLRASLGSARSHLVLQQLELRARGTEKFSLAGEMFFTRAGLEQSTDEVVARYKAQRFPHGAPIADVCCGIGGDLMALAKRGPVLGVDADPAVALLAEANCRLIAGALVQVQADLAENIEFTDVAAWHIDPDRRATGRRTTRIEAYQPTVETLERLRAQRPACAIKLAPAAEPPAHWTAEAELEWISRRGQCRQLVAWFDAVARWPGQHAATVIKGESDAPRTLHGSPAIVPPLRSQLGRFVFEPDAAVLAANLTGALADEHALHRFESEIGYLTGDSAIDDLALAAFEVLDLLPLDMKKLRRYLQHRQTGQLEVKKRGVTHDPDVVRRQLTGSCRGEQPLTLLLTRLAGRTVAIAARRLA
jgi:hypothetical protein